MADSQDLVTDPPADGNNTSATPTPATPTDPSSTTTTTPTDPTSSGATTAAIAPTPAPVAAPASTRLSRLTAAQAVNSTWLAFGIEDRSTQSSIVDALGEPIAFRRWGHPDWPSGVKHFGDVARNDEDHDFGGTTAMLGVSQIVLHETAGFGGCWPHWGVHFYIDEDGIIHQCADVSAQLNHATNGVINAQAVGIELSNNPWASSPPSDRQKLTKAKWPCDSNLTIVLPRQDQLEKLVWLINKICNTRGVTVPGDWRNIWPAPEKMVPASGFIALGNASTSATLTATAETSGILSHSMVPHHKHSDGAFPALYTWLRISQGRPPADAWDMAVGRIVTTPIANPPELDATITVLDAAFG